MEDVERGRKHRGDGHQREFGKALFVLVEATACFFAGVEHCLSLSRNRFDEREQNDAPIFQCIAVHYMRYSAWVLCERKKKNISLER